LVDEKEIRALCLDLLENGWPAYVTTVDAKGYPQTRAMFNLRNRERFPKLIPFFDKHREDFTVMFTTNTSSTKITELKARPPISVYYCNPDKWRGVMFGGDIEVVDDPDQMKEFWHDDWTNYYPKGYDDPDHTMLRLVPAIAKGWAGSMTFRLELGDKQ
jgi:general stress protein 26